MPPSIEANLAYMLLKPHLEVGDDGAILDQELVAVGGKFRGHWIAGDHVVYSVVKGDIVLSLT